MLIVSILLLYCCCFCGHTIRCVALLLLLLLSPTMGIGCWGELNIYRFQIDNFFLNSKFKKTVTATRRKNKKRTKEKHRNNNSSGVISNSNTITSRMKTKSNTSNTNDSLVVDGTGTVTGTIDNNNNNNNNNEEQVTTTATMLATMGPSIMPQKTPGDREGGTGRGQQQSPHHGGTVGDYGTARSVAVNIIRSVFNVDRPASQVSARHGKNNSFLVNFFVKVFELTEHDTKTLLVETNATELELEFNRTLTTCNEEQGGLDAILQRPVEGGGRQYQISRIDDDLWGVCPLTMIFFSYLDQESLIEASSVNKQWNNISHSPMMELVPYFRLTFDLSSAMDGITNFVCKMKEHRRDPVKWKYIQGYKRFELHLIGDQPTYHDRHEKGMRNAINATSQILTKEEEQQYISNIRMDGIVSLVITTASNKTKDRNLTQCYWNFFSQMFPQLCALNLLDRECNGQLLDYGFETFSNGDCPHLKKLVFEKMNRRILWCGSDQYLLSDLKEIYFDDLAFVFDPDLHGDLVDDEEIESVQFLDYYSSNFKRLERLSLRNARYFEGDWPLPPPTSSNKGKKIPQDALLKFVRNAPPALIWFRSDLTEENIKKLKLERPNIDFVN